MEIPVSFVKYHLKITAECFTTVIVLIWIMKAIKGA